MRERGGIKEEIIKKINMEMDEEMLEKVRSSIFKNLLIAIVLLIYFYFVNLGYINIGKNIFITDLKVFSLCILVMSIILFEIAYYKDNGVLAIHGIEALVLAITTIYLINPYFYMARVFLLIPLTVPFAFAIYYVVKSTIIYIGKRKEYVTSLSDVSEIIKKSNEIWGRIIW